MRASARHPGSPGGSDACSADMLLEALAACAGVTLRSVATAMGIQLVDARERNVAHERGALEPVAHALERAEGFVERIAAVDAHGTHPRDRSEVASVREQDAALARGEFSHQRAAELRFTADLLHARGELDLHADFVNESFIGTRFVGRLVGTAEVGGVPAVVPEFSGRAWITGTATYMLDPADPFPHGFVL